MDLLNDLPGRLQKAYADLRDARVKLNSAAHIAAETEFRYDAARAAHLRAGVEGGNDMQRHAHLRGLLTLELSAHDAAHAALRDAKCAFDIAQAHVDEARHILRAHEVMQAARSGGGEARS